MLGSLVPRKRSLFPTTGRFSRMMNRMEDEMEDLAQRFLGNDEGFLTTLEFAPTTDVAETEDRFEVTVDLPGLKPEEVNVELKDGQLWISGKHEEEKEEKGKTFHRMERRRGEFRRVLPMPTSIHDDKIEASFDKGVLKVIVPKLEGAKPKHIEVKA